MQLKDLEIGRKFIFKDGRNSKIYVKLSNNGDIATYNLCKCLSNKENPLVLDIGFNDKKFDKTVEITPIN